MSATSEANERLRRSLASRPTRKYLDRAVGQWTVRIITLAVLLVAWQLGTQNLNRAIAAPPTEILAEFGQQMFVTATIWMPLLQSLSILLGGLALALIIGIPIGIAMGRSRTVAYVLDPYVSFLYALPHIALVPVMIIALGFDWQFRLVYVVFASVWPIIINTSVGVRNVSPLYTDAAIAYCANERQIIRHVVFPSAAPYIVAGGRQAFSVAWTSTVVSEILSNLAGLGGQIELDAVQYLTAKMFVPILIIMIIAIIIQTLTAWAQRRFTPWQS